MPHVICYLLDAVNGEVTAMHMLTLDDIELLLGIHNCRIKSSLSFSQEHLTDAGLWMLQL